MIRDPDEAEQISITNLDHWHGGKPGTSSDDCILGYSVCLPRLLE